ncbi:MAG: MiaB/RimO family radical SAM methylthiotransferase, partial [Spirochaetota bacterium]|nr:MiaB/RimO family radical SAM methylthiotransferase [Spirochaetota bacterium]
MKKTIAFGTLGCKLNQFESDCLVSEFRKNGYDVVPLSEKADAYIVNTCTVTNKSDAKSRNMMHKLSRNNPDALLFVTGCYADTDRDRVAQIDGVNYVISNDKKYKLFQIVTDALNDQMVDLDSIEGNRFLYEPGENSSHTRGYLKIQDGCDEGCSYCKIPLARGLAESRPLNDVISSVRQMLNFGHREIILTGINIGDYSFMGETLASLIEKILRLDEDFRLHLSSVEPNKITEELIGLLDHAKLCSHMHIPLQSGSDSVLKSMGRSYDSALFRKVVMRVYEKHDWMNITTDAMVGFPGETEKDFMDTMNLVEELGVSHVHTFKYSV